MERMTFRRWLTRLTTSQGRVLIAAGAAAGALIAVFRATQPDTPAPRIQGDFATVEASSPTCGRVLELVTSAHFENGNDVEILLNGDETCPGLSEDLRNAGKSIAVQSYYSIPGAMPDTHTTSRKSLSASAFSPRGCERGQTMETRVPTGMFS